MTLRQRWSPVGLPLTGSWRFAPARRGVILRSTPLRVLATPERGAGPVGDRGPRGSPRFEHYSVSIRTCFLYGSVSVSQNRPLHAGAGMSTYRAKVRSVDAG